MATDAKAKLLEALEEIEEVEQDLGAEVRHIAIVYSVYRTADDGTIHQQEGRVNSSDPDWLVAALLRHMAEHLEEDEQEPEDE